jgi:hypothetical protein
VLDKFLLGARTQEETEFKFVTSFEFVCEIEGEQLFRKIK